MANETPKNLTGPLSQAVGDLSASQAGLAQSIVEKMGSWGQWGAIGIMGICSVLLVGGGLWFGNAILAQHASDLKAVLDSSQAQHSESITAQNRQVDTLVTTIKDQVGMTTKSIDRLADEIQGSRKMYQDQIAVEKERNARPPVSPAKGPDKPDGI